MLAAAEDSGALFLAGGVVGGAGFGVAFLGALRALSAAIPPEHRAGVMSAFYVVAYLAISLHVRAESPREASGRPATNSTLRFVVR